MKRLNMVIDELASELDAHNLEHATSTAREHNALCEGVLRRMA